MFHLDPTSSSGSYKCSVPSSSIVPKTWKKVVRYSFSRNTLLTFILCMWISWVFLNCHPLFKESPTCLSFAPQLWFPSLLSSQSLPPFPVCSYLPIHSSSGSVQEMAGFPLLSTKHTISSHVV